MENAKNTRPKLTINPPKSRQLCTVGGGGELGTVEAAGDFHHAIRHREHRTGQNNQSGHRTHNDRVQEGTKTGDNTLANRIVGLAGGVGDRRTTKSRLIGEDTTGDTKANYRTEKTTTDRLAGKGVSKDPAKRLTDLRQS